MPFFFGHNRECDLVSVRRPDRAKAIVAWNVFEDYDLAAREIGDGNVTFGTGSCLRVFVCVERQSSCVRRKKLGNDPAAIFFASLPSRLAIQTLLPRSK